VIAGRQMSKTARTIAVIALAAACGGCWAGVYEDPAAEYLHRSDTITLSAGNAKDVNATTHMIDPWPRHVANRRIPGHGERMEHAIEHYKSGAPAAPSSQSGVQVIGVPVGSATPQSQSPGIAPAP
jgi:hypothetical protein